MLEELQRREGKEAVALVRELMAERRDGRLKLYVTSKVLTFRRQCRALFEQGAYIPLEVSAAQQGQIIAFARRVDERWALVVVPRLLTKLSPAARPPLGKRIWKDSCLFLPAGAPTDWRNLFTGEGVRVSEAGMTAPQIPLHTLFRRLPVAVVVSVTPADVS
jgi:(1->4)-alpha-D-glucan 1-alpha-D-glucosylmutase